MENAEQTVGMAVHCSGDVEIVTADGDRHTLQINEAIHIGDMLIAKQGAHIDLFFHDGYRHTVQEGEQFRLDERTLGELFSGQRPLDDFLPPTGSGSSGSGSDESHYFVRLDRVVEDVTPIEIPKSTDTWLHPQLIQEAPSDNIFPTVVSVEPGAPGTGDDAVIEGNNLVYTVTLSNESTVDTTFAFSLGGG
ncbi:MAG: hypothetical protein HGA75_15825, partial [Thiobacillus sp.]|nr:hypothetical protein [Thiobacillus sp.]